MPNKVVLPSIKSGVRSQSENRRIQIKYSGSENLSQFVYDGFGRVVTIIETTAGDVTNTLQFIWLGPKMREARDGSGVIVSQYFDLGQNKGGTSYFYAKDHLDSVREVRDSAGNIVGEYDYDPFGQTVSKSGTFLADCLYAGTYTHGRSALLLMVFRAYSSVLGRFLNRDPLQEVGGINLYCYANNSVPMASDPLGLMIGQPGDSNRPVVPGPGTSPILAGPSPPPPSGGGGDPLLLVAPNPHPSNKATIHAWCYKSKLDLKPKKLGSG